MSLTLFAERGRIRTLRKQHRPPSSSGPGRGPLKAKTGVRVPLGALKLTHLELRDAAVEDFLEMLRFQGRSKHAELPGGLLRECSR
jgi:hypothetical protein